MLIHKHDPLVQHKSSKMRGPLGGMHVQILLALIIYAIVVAARFEDQAGAYDWYKQHIGIATSAQFHPSKPRVCVATEQSVVGCLNLRDGSIAWRKSLQTAHAAPSVAYVESSSSLVTASGGLVRAFDLEGGLKWQRKLPVQSGAFVSEVKGKGSDNSSGAILAVQAGAVQVRTDGSRVCAGPPRRTAPGPVRLGTRAGFPAMDAESMNTTKAQIGNPCPTWALCGQWYEAAGVPVPMHGCARKPTFPMWNLPGWHSLGMAPAALAALPSEE